MYRYGIGVSMVILTHLILIACKRTGSKIQWSYDICHPLPYSNEKPVTKKIKYAIRPVFHECHVKFTIILVVYKYLYSLKVELLERS